MASSSQTASASFPSSAPSWKYDVFLSFRGVDTRKGITFELYDRLHNGRGIKTFMDGQDLDVGALISPRLFKAIEESMVAIVVLSSNYASSSWCLEELTKICQCMQDDDRILPVFYHVEPSDVRYQRKSFEEAFTKHENCGRQKMEMQQWRDALNRVANFCGWHTQNYKTERELVHAIVKSVCSKVRPIKIDFTMSNGDFKAFEATKRAMNKVMNELNDDEVTVIGVYGMGGVGKTTMVKHVGEQMKKSRLFNQVIMAVVSQNPDLRKIQGTLADLLDLKLEDETEIGRACRLEEEIKRGTKILIILDDVWNRIELSSIGIPSHDKLQRRNSKVLLTTRRLSVCHFMNSHANIPLDILSEEDAWNLFVTEARQCFDRSTSFYDVARMVARECAGLPVALIAVARALRYASFNEWKHSAQRLKASQPATPEDEGGVYKCIKLSYDYLKSDESKSFFLLCCLFPDDYDISVDQLLKYGIGKGMFQDSNMQEARATAHLVVKSLQASSLLLDSKKDGCVRMHDVIRDVAILISISEVGNQVFVKASHDLKHWPMINAHKGYSAISVMKNQIGKLPKELVCPNLRILLLQHNPNLNEIPETFLHTLNELGVLDLSYTSISLLPQSLSLLTNLQALYLDCCKKIIDFSILGKLEKLEILSMREYPLKELSREIGRLTNLRMLDVSDGSWHGHIVTIPTKVISKMHKLEELYMHCRFGEWGSKVKEEGEETNIGFDELTGLSYLYILTVRICDVKCLPKCVEFIPNWIYFDIRFGGDRRAPHIQSQIGHEYSRSLLLNTTICTLPDWFVSVVTKKTENLQFAKCEGLNNILVEYDRGKLCELKHLSIIGPCEKLKELMNITSWYSHKPVFENLEELHLDGVKSLTKLCVGELPIGSLFNLKLLNVCNCRNLGDVLLSSKLLRRLPNLEKVICNVMISMEYVFGYEGFEPEESKLREMTMLSLYALRSICNGPAPRTMFQTLKSLLIYHCDQLGGSLFTYDVAQCLFHLEDLFIFSCPLLKNLIEASEETVSKKKIVLPKMKSLVLLMLPRLSSENAIHIESPSLMHLYIQYCPNFLNDAIIFHNKNQVQLNDELQMRFLWSRLMNNIP
ncbi:PREDICTED: probable disease resistance protein At4g27220 isoform X2 [Fragaria vesca subsp. vesca]|uniref:probable disease resistance protein At4g27220 isoform X2 n=1 Tax=Fragaria vesca subsp. vesca TaxID=101020 RepID=UPI0002C352F7|nr:PREDICTED: probable disease resistance protein At4g27220 isoform X2 [Fragaria vesca subsp. vesca]